MMNEQAGREKFSKYYEDLKAAQKADGGGVGKRDEWELFIETQIENGDAPETARAWKMPRSTKSI